MFRTQDSGREMESYINEESILGMT